MRVGNPEAKDRSAIPRLRICGDWSATTGLANAARRLALALLEAGADLAVETIASGAPRLASLFPAELRPLQDHIESQVTLWTLNVNELPQLPRDELNDEDPLRYHIATWYWELPTMPKWMQDQIRRVSEIWVPTRFVQRAVRRYTAKAVTVVPPVVPTFRYSGNVSVLRDRLGVPARRTLFLFTFDYNSTVSRKNPFGVIQAFAHAFAGDRHRFAPFLILKMINADRDPAFVRAVEEAIRPLEALLIREHVSADDLAGLFHASDVYVSLHRSEGFGLGLAEAMAIGKPVIGTAYSGNMDFMTVGNSCLVGYRLRQIDDQDYHHNAGMESTYTRGSLWAEPDLDQAAAWMDILASDARLRQEIGAAGREVVLGQYAPTAVGRLALDRLHDVYHRREIGQPINAGAHRAPIVSDPEGLDQVPRR